MGGGQTLVFGWEQLNLVSRSSMLPLLFNIKYRSIQSKKTHEIVVRAHLQLIYYLKKLATKWCNQCVSLITVRQKQQ
jgi:hypothetical protein